MSPATDHCPEAQQRRHDPRARPWRLPEPARGDDLRRRGCAAQRLPPDRHRRCLRQRARGRRGPPPLRGLARRGLPHHQAVDQRLRLRGGEGRLRRQPAPARRRSRRPLPPPPAAAVRLRAHDRRLQGRRVVARRRTGRARSASSNFIAEHLRTLIDRTDVVPAVNQVEIHPYFSQPALRAVHAELGILTQAWSPIGGILVYVPAATRATARSPTRS